MLEPNSIFLFLRRPMLMPQKNTLQRLGFCPLESIKLDYNFILFLLIKKNIF